MTIPALMLARLLLSAAAAAALGSEAETQILVVASDRGFRGNATIEARFSDYQADYPEARLFFMTARRQEERLETELRRVGEHGRNRLVLLPLVLSENEGDFQSFLDDLETVRSRLGGRFTVSARPPFGRSVAAARILDDHLREARAETAGEEARTVVLGSRASDEATARAIREALESLVTALPDNHGKRPDIEVLFAGRDPDTLEKNARVYERVSGTPRTLVVPFFLDFRADAHMAVEAGVSRALSASGAVLYTTMPDEHAALSDWMRRESAAALPLTRESLGIVVLAHGSDRVWNDEIREALAPLSQTYDVELSFNMADRALVERAVQALEARGRRHIVIYRLFGLSSSFAASIASMTASEVSPPQHRTAHAGHGTETGPLAILSGAHLATFGGIDDHPLFAEALLARAEAMSGTGERARDVVLLIAHGAGDDGDDAHWRSLLASLAERMQAQASPPFHDIVGATLREDWPEKKGAALAQIETIVRGHQSAGRRVFVVEARLNGPGPTRRLLAELGLELEVDDQGFVPHPNVSRLVREEIEAYLERETGIQHAGAGAGAGAIPGR